MQSHRVTVMVFFCAGNWWARISSGSVSQGLDNRPLFQGGNDCSKTHEMTGENDEIINNLTNGVIRGTHPSFWVMGVTQRVIYGKLHSLLYITRWCHQHALAGLFTEMVSKDGIDVCLSFAGFYYNPLDKILRVILTSLLYCWIYRSIRKNSPPILEECVQWCVPIKWGRWHGVRHRHFVGFHLKVLLKIGLPFLRFVRPLPILPLAIAIVRQDPCCPVAST